MESLTPSEEEERDNVDQEGDETVDNQQSNYHHHRNHTHNSHQPHRGGVGMKQDSSTLSAARLGKHQTYSGLVSRRTPLSASVKSAFSNYVRTGCRGEPDGRTAASGDSRGRESDAAFTPSPVDPVHRSNLLAHQGRTAHGANGSIAGLLAGMSSSAGSDRGVPVPSLRMSLTLAHQSKIRSMYCSRQSLTSQENGSSPASEVGTPSSLMMQMANSSGNLQSRPDSSSSANSSVADWESGLSTVRRQPPPPPPPQNTSSGSKVEDISAFGDSRLRVGTMAKAFEMHGGSAAGTTLANARSGRSRFKPPNSNSHFAAGLRKMALGHSAVAVEEANASTNNSAKSASRSGSLDTLDRLSVRSEVVIKPPPAVQQQQMTQLQKEQQRRRHRSVDRHLDTDADSVIEVDSTASSTTDALINERFSAAVFQHRAVGGVKKLSLAKVAASNHIAGNSGTLMHHGKPPVGQMMTRVAPKMSLANKQQHQMQLHHPIEAIGCVSDHEMDPPSSAIYSLRSGDADVVLGIASNVSGVNSNGSRNNIQDHIIATQMNRLNREMPISDVYHERNMGLGLAPGLAELLVTSQQQQQQTGSSSSIGLVGVMGGVGPVATSSSVASSEDVFSSFDQISLADTATELSDKADLAALKSSVGYAKRPPPRPAKPNGGHHSSASSTSSWSNGAAGYHHVGSRQRMSVFSDSSDGGADLTSAAFRQSMLEMTRRDEADGRSMTDSNYSGYSPHRNLKLSTIMQHHGQAPSNDLTVLGAGPAKGSNTIHAVAIIEADHSRTSMINESTV